MRRRQRAVGDVMRNTLVVLEAAGRNDVPVGAGAEPPAAGAAGRRPARARRGRHGRPRTAGPAAVCAGPASRGRAAPRLCRGGCGTRETRSRSSPGADDQHRPAAPGPTRTSSPGSAEIVFMGGGAHVGNATAVGRVQHLPRPRGGRDRPRRLRRARRRRHDVRPRRLLRAASCRPSWPSSWSPCGGHGPAELAGRPDLVPPRAGSATGRRHDRRRRRGLRPSSTGGASRTERLPRARRARRHVDPRAHHRRPPRLERRHGARPARAAAPRTRRRRPRDRRSARSPALGRHRLPGGRR